MATAAGCTRIAMEVVAVQLRIDRSMQEVSENLFGPIDQSIGLPNFAYTEPSIYERETRTIFFNRWCSVAFASDIPEKGQVKSIEFCGLPLFMARDRDDSIRVFHNVCPHRGTRLVDGVCIKRKIVCPYHAWSFDLDGRLSRAAHYPNVDPDNLGLNEVRTAVWNDVVLVNLSGQAPTLSEVLRPLIQRWSKFDLSSLVYGGALRYDFNANWKLIVENFLECYHVPAVHPELAEYSKFSNRYPIFFADEFLGQGSKIYRPDPVEIELPRWSGVGGNDEFEAEYIVIFPNTLIGRMPDHVFIWSLNPLSAQQTIETLKFYFIGDNSLDDIYAADRAATFERWKTVNGEDFDVIQQLHAGMKSVYFQGARFVPDHEEVVQEFQRLALKEMGV